MTCETYRDIIAAHVDGQLTYAERHEAEQHLVSCKNCAQLFADQQQFRQISRTWHWETPIPLEVEHRLRAAMAAERSPLQSWWQKAREQFASWLQPQQSALAFAAAAALLLTFVLPKAQTSVQNQAPLPEAAKSTEQTVLDAAASYYKAVRTGELPLSYATNNPRELENALKASEQLNFSVYVPDLRLAGYELNGGIVVQIGGKPAVITVYQGEEGQVLCLRQGGTMPPPPRGARQLREQEYLYSRPGQTALYKQLPGQFRVIVSGLPAETFLTY
jgi:anti-sigma factor RsiW